VTERKMPLTHAVRTRLVLLFASVCVATVAAEAIARVVDGYRLSPLRLELRPDRLAAVNRAHLQFVVQKWRGETDAADYVRQLPVARGVDRDWFTAVQPPPAPPYSPERELEARAKRYPGAELQANYEWNSRVVSEAVCEGALRDVADFDQFESLFVFDPVDGSDLPTFRFLRHAAYPSGLRTNAFGWRGPEIALNKPAHTFRIAFVGASTTVGPHAEPYSYPELVGVWLNRWAASQGLDVSFDVVAVRGRRLERVSEVLLPS